MLARATPAELARIPRIRAEFRPWRPLAFELQRRGCAARGWVLPGSSASILHGRWPSCGDTEKARIGRDLFRSAKKYKVAVDQACATRRADQFRRPDGRYPSTK